MPEGVVKHDSIATAPRKSWECTVGWLAHYAIEAIFALALVLLASPKWLQQPTILPPLLWGLRYGRGAFLRHAAFFRLGHCCFKDN
jgi:hypothetical protein